MTMSVRRLEGNPIITRGTSTSIGSNINGPSLVVAPPWLANPLGRYYLYFAHHTGDFIRLATADHLGGPWVVYEPGTLSLADSLFATDPGRGHIASPDVHLDPAAGTMRMYFHGKHPGVDQFTRVAISSDGINFNTLPERLGYPYFRVIRHDGWWYALGKPGVLFRSLDGLSNFEEGPTLFIGRSLRHHALLVHGGELLVFWTQKGDRPERILCSRIDLGTDWRNWRLGSAEEVIEPEMPWEGADLPLANSAPGKAKDPVRQLRDPAIFQEEGRTFLLYSVAGEMGIAIAELDLPAPQPSASSNSESSPEP